MTQLRILDVRGSDAPNRQATLLVGAYNEIRGFYAYYEPGFCGCGECHPIIGHGDTEEEAIADYWEQWTEKYGEFA